MGSQKYGFDDVRNVLERASARETAARVTVGAFCRAFLGELNVALLSHVVQIGTVKTSKRRQLPTPDDLAAIDRSPVRCFDPDASKRMVAEIDRLRKERDTIGGSSRSWRTALRRAWVPTCTTTASSTRGWRWR